MYIYISLTEILIPRIQFKYNCMKQDRMSDLRFLHMLMLTKQIVRLEKFQSRKKYQAGHCNRRKLASSHIDFDEDRKNYSCQNTLILIELK